MTTITINQAQLASVNALLNGIQRDTKTALRRSINKTAAAAKTLVAKEVGKTVTLKSKKIKEYISIRKASNDRLSAKITLRGASMPAILFANRKLAKGVSVKIWKAEQGVKFRHHFYATIHSGHTGIFKRSKISPGVYSPRLPIEEMFGPSITTIYEKTPGLSQQVQTTSADRLLSELHAQVNFILSRRNG